MESSKNIAKTHPQRVKELEAQSAELHRLLTAAYQSKALSEEQLYIGGRFSKKAVGFELFEIIRLVETAQKMLEGARAYKKDSEFKQLYPMLTLVVKGIQSRLNSDYEDSKKHHPTSASFLLEVKNKVGPILLGILAECEKVLGIPMLTEDIGETVNGACNTINAVKTPNNKIKESVTERFKAIVSGEEYIGKTQEAKMFLIGIKLAKTIAGLHITKEASKQKELNDTLVRLLDETKVRSKDDKHKIFTPGEELIAYVKRMVNHDAYWKKDGQPVPKEIMELRKVLNNADKTPGEKIHLAILTAQKLQQEKTPQKGKAKKPISSAFFGKSTLPNMDETAQHLCTAIAEMNPVKLSEAYHIIFPKTLRSAPGPN